ncbi:MAG TPA: DinB family protein [Flavisolibacter sp.]|nr:DinB family protein [Flavisolibacter sp.]
MKKFKSEELIDQLEADVRQLIAAAEHLQQADNVKLSYPPEEGKWSAAQALEHLNMYNRYYLPAIEKAMVHIPKEVNAWFVPGFFGNYFTNMMMPKNVYEVKNRMKAMKGYRPDRGINVEGVFKEFYEHQNKLIQLLETARKRNLEQVRVPTSISTMIRLKLGDTFRFLIAHEQRHMIQARNAIRATGVSTDKFPVILEAARL